MRLRPIRPVDAHDLAQQSAREHLGVAQLLAAHLTVLERELGEDTLTEAMDGRDRGLVEALQLTGQMRARLVG